MDTSLLNLEEHFPTCYVDEESEDSNKAYFNEWEDERELNGDIGLIPESSSFNESFKDMSELTNSPPSLLYQKMIDWSSLVFGDSVDAFSQAITEPLQEQELDQKSSLVNSFDDKDVNNFDLAAYITEPPKVKSVGKKIDKDAQKYIIEDKNEKIDTSDEIDVETVFEGGSLPVLEANDAFSLLEQFEASEKPNLLNSKNEKSNLFEFSNSLVNGPIEILEKNPQVPLDIFEDNVKTVDNTKDKLKEGPVCVKPEEVVKTKQEVKTPYVKNKQILEALPQELIARINESGKRKTITVIPPIPTKKRGASRSVDSISQSRSKIMKTNEQVKLDHDYCVASTPYPKEPRKDSGFQSSEEDDRSIIRNQPTIKTADGKLMVSLLKVNTIRNNTNYINNNQKKKLNLEEYKKRRFINSNPTSQSNSPVSSTCSSPLPLEDENLKRIKHQEKLMKMATELLNTPAKSSKESSQSVRKIFQTPSPQKVQVIPDKIVPPPDLEVKTFVSIGTNTEISSINCSKSIMASTQQLEEIKPLLQKVSDKINSNSFITSLIENIPKAKTKINSYVKSENQEVVREDKIIHYLKKDREPVKTNTVGCQTIDDDTDSRYRRRIDRSSRSSSRSSSFSGIRRRRSSSASSSTSQSSDSRSTSSRSSRSRSRSISPKRSRQYSAERLREVEERRVIYVGRINKGTTKEDLRRRFLSFGPITNVSLHFRDYGDNYGFVTFANKEDAYEAVEHGNDHAYPKYDLSFGGRRIFCKTSYSDLDNMREDDYSCYMSRSSENSFDALLRAAQEKIRKRKP